jgi:hypothetical protein
MDEKAKIILKSALQQIEAQETAATEAAIQKNYSVIIAPHFAALDSKQDKAIKEITDKYNADIAKIKSDVTASKLAFERSQKEAVKLSISAEYRELKEDLQKKISN